MAGIRQSKLLICLAYDVRAGARHVALAAAGVFLLSIALLTAAYATARVLAIDASDFDLADNIGMVLAGVPRHEWRAGTSLLPPLGWLLLVQTILFSSLEYPARDLFACGGRSLIAVGSRRVWIISKLIWVASMTLMCLLVVVIAALLWTVFCGQSIELDIHRSALEAATVSYDWIVVEKRSSMAFLLGAALSLISLAELQTAVAIAVHPLIAFAMSGAHLMLSAYLQTPLLLGNALMLTRWEGMVSGGVSYVAALALALFVLVGGIILCLLFMYRVDVQDRRSFQWV